MEMNKTFDCIAMKNAIQAQIYAEIEHMTADERIAYFNRNNQAETPFWQQIKQQKTRFNLT